MIKAVVLVLDKDNKVCSIRPFYTVEAANRYIYSLRHEGANCRRVTHRTDLVGYNYTTVGLTEILNFLRNVV